MITQNDSIFVSLDKRFEVARAKINKGLFVVWDNDANDLHKEFDGSTRYYGSLEVAIASFAEVKKNVKRVSHGVRGKTPNPDSGLGIMRTLIQEGKLSDKEIHAILLAKGITAYKNPSFVAYKRRKMGLPAFIKATEKVEVSEDFDIALENWANEGGLVMEMAS